MQHFPPKRNENELCWTPLCMTNWGQWGIFTLKPSDTRSEGWRALASIWDSLQIFDVLWLLEFIFASVLFSYHLKSDFHDFFAIYVKPSTWTTAGPKIWWEGAQLYWALAVWICFFFIFKRLMFNCIQFLWNISILSSNTSFSISQISTHNMWHGKVLKSLIRKRLRKLAILLTENCDRDSAC